MNIEDVRRKVAGLLAIAAPGSGAGADEANTASQLAARLCAKYGVTPSTPRSAPASTTRHALPGQVKPGWTPPQRPQPQNDQGWGWWQWAARPFGARESGYSGVTDAQARIMAITILSSGTYLDGAEQEIIESALNGLLTEYGKVLLDGIYTLTTQ